MSNASSIYFGYSIAVKGLLRYLFQNYNLNFLTQACCSLYVGAPGLNSNTGSVFAFGFIVDGDSVGSYVLMTTFSAADGQTNDMFGYSLAVSAAGLLAVGAPGQSVYESGSGAVYLFDISTGMQLQIYIPECAFSETNECTGNAFGQSVGLSGLNKEV